MVVGGPGTTVVNKGRIVSPDVAGITSHPAVVPRLYETVGTGGTPVPTAVPYFELMKVTLVVRSHVLGGLGEVGGRPSGGATPGTIYRT